jgi:ABC-type multidrug transport system ATPase subunit
MRTGTAGRQRVKDIRVVGLVKAFGKTTAVDHVDFEVPAGSIATLLNGR